MNSLVSNGIAEAVPIQEACPWIQGPELMKAPPVVWLAGDASLLTRPGRVAVIGTRKPSEAGRALAKEIAHHLFLEGGLAVSGLAEGIDTIVHSETIRIGGRTIAVIGTPPERAYPKFNEGLQEEIAKEHLLLSQFAPGSRVYQSNFVARNRTMALVAQATIIVECADSSGTLSQASETMRLGRPLFLSRMMVERTDVEWPKKFLAAGAMIYEDAYTVLEACR